MFIGVHLLPVQSLWTNRLPFGNLIEALKPP